ncbi:KH domain-containing protein [Sulfurovum sp. TSL1]|uniref:KH domain-containing protein n=1 Tax=Sulfurovum sp. TSL1 TaxID=2826994 RepID=UPI001CC60D63|nr:KH domain-containing protein [Sulfurovum sp. TSL1]GIT99025.1 RNA-binding protein [Sulfurovum sp. TSL1]
MVKDFLLSYTKLLVHNPEDISIEITEVDESFDEITIFANSEDIGKLIGKEGKMINSIKTVISGCKAKGGKNYRVNVKASK